jgi:hypothetical protein
LNLLFGALRQKSFLEVEFFFNPKSKITAVQYVPKMSSWTKKMPDFAGHSYFFENEFPSFCLRPTKKRPFKQEPTEKTEPLPLTHFLRSLYQSLLIS